MHLDCTASGSATIRVSDPGKIEADQAKLLEENPFMSAEQIFELYDKQLSEELDSDFDEYCTCDDYYPPVVEDYDENYKHFIQEFCIKYGREMLDYECEGDTSDFIPNHHDERW